MPNTLANGTIDINKKYNTIADKKLNTITNKTINTNKR